MVRTSMLLAGLLVSFSAHARAAEDWKNRLNPTERACLERIETTEGQISGIRTVQAIDRPGAFSLLLEVDRAGGPVKLRCQGTMRPGGEQVTDVTRE
ncbi:hypothetical protein ACVIQY_005150 [Bradyrhizobium sp. USDA 3051]|jgi:hypothetical protein